LTAAYVVERGTAASIGLASLASANAAWSSGGFIEVDAALMPGVYRFDVPNVVFATADKSVVMLKGATNMAPVVLEYQIVGFNPDDAVRLGLTAIPNVAQGTTGAISTGNATGQVTVVTNNDKTGYSLTTAPLTTAQTASAVWDALLASYTTVNSFGARVVRTLSSSTTNEVTIGASNHIAANIHAMQNNVITAAAIATDAITSDELATSALTEIADAILNRSLAAAGAANNIAITSISSPGTFNAVNTLVVDDRVAFVGTAPANFALGVAYWVRSTVTSTTFELALTQGGLGVSTGSTGAFTATKITGRDILSAMRAIRNKSVIASGTLTVYQEDDTAAAWTATVGSDPSANPIISIDPT
jgi:alpha-D-ribose 1-methylphosphonate 5-triphosphate synthase subunit PhnG